MANTTNVDVTQTNKWVKVIDGPSNQTFTFSSTSEFCTAPTATPPDENFIGHREENMIGIDLLTGESMYVRSSRKTTVIITEV